MARKIKAKIGSYQKGGETKGRYVDIGVILNNDNGDYVLLNAEVSLAGILAQQNAIASADGKPARTNVMCSIFDNDNQQGQPQQPPSNGFDDDINF